MNNLKAKTAKKGQGVRKYALHGGWITMKEITKQTGLSKSSICKKMTYKTLDQIYDSLNITSKETRNELV